MLGTKLRSQVFCRSSKRSIPVAFSLTPLCYSEKHHGIGAYAYEKAGAMYRPQTSNGGLRTALQLKFAKHSHDFHMGAGKQRRFKISYIYKLLNNAFSLVPAQFTWQVCKTPQNPGNNYHLPRGQNSEWWLCRTSTLLFPVLSFYKDKL